MKHTVTVALAEHLSGHKVYMLDAAVSAGEQGFMGAAHESGIALPGAVMMAHYLNAALDHGKGENTLFSCLNYRSDYRALL